MAAAQCGRLSSQLPHYPDKKQYRAGGKDKTGEQASAKA
jgi:hypothetical protein